MKYYLTLIVLFLCFNAYSSSNDENTLKTPISEWSDSSLVLSVGHYDIVQDFLYVKVINLDIDNSYFHYLNKYLVRNGKGGSSFSTDMSLALDSQCVNNYGSKTPHSNYTLKNELTSYKENVADYTKYGNSISFNVLKSFCDEYIGEKIAVDDLSILSIVASIYSFHISQKHREYMLSDGFNMYGIHHNINHILIRKTDKGDDYNIVTWSYTCMLITKDYQWHK